MPTNPTDLPPGDAPGDPLDRVTLDASLTKLLMVVLDSLTPAKRVAFSCTTSSASPTMPFPRSSVAAQPLPGSSLVRRVVRFITGISMKRNPTEPAGSSMSSFLPVLPETCSGWSNFSIQKSLC